MVAKTDQEKMQAELHMHRLWSGEGGIVEMVVSGKRDPEEVVKILQAIKNNKFRLGNGVEGGASGAANPAKPFTNLISTGNFSYVNPNITEANFPDVGINCEGAKAYHFDKDVSSDYALKKMEKDGYRPANFRELLTWMLANWNGKDAVVALGQAWRDSDGGLFVPYLDDWRGERDLSLDYLENDWCGHCRFLAFRKSSRR